MKLPYDKIVIHDAIDQHWWTIRGKNGRTLLTSETYRRLSGCVKSAKAFGARHDIAVYRKEGNTLVPDCRPA